VGAREEHRTASEAFAIRFDTRWERTSRLRAFDHYYTHRLQKITRKSVSGMPPPHCFWSLYRYARPAAIAPV
jgi:hypothetical protein